MYDKLDTFLNTKVFKNVIFNPNAGRIEFWDEELLNFLNSISRPEAKTIAQKVYDYVHGYNINPPSCKTCGGDLKFETYSRPYKSFCSAKCSAINSETRNKYSGTIMDRFGVNHIFDIPEKKESRKQTMLRKYGVEYGGQSEQFKEMARNTCIQKYGVEHTSKLKTNRDKAVSTSIERYGTSHFSQKHLSVSQVELFNDYDFMSNNDIATIAKQTGYSTTAIGNQLKRMGILIPDIYKSGFEKEVVAFIHEALDDNDVSINDKKIIAPYELDIFIPKLNFAIECNGDYWHSVNAGADKNKHKNKFHQCNNNNIRLFQIFEHQWQDDIKQSIWKSMITNVIDRNKITTIYARKCQIKEVDAITANEFLSQNHLQGNCRSSKRFGLFYNNELVSLMTFGKSRFADEIELLRFANKLYTNVIGGGSKLLKEAQKHYNAIVSYSDNTYSSGNFYRTVGFTKIQETLGMFYVKNGVRYNRINLQKHRLANILTEYDSSLTADQNLIDNNFLKIYDAGQTKWKM